MAAKTPELYEAAKILFRQGPGSDPTAWRMIADAGKEALQRGGLEAMNDLLDEVHAYSRDTMHAGPEYWRMVAVVWEADIAEWGKA